MPKHYVTRLAAALGTGQGAERLYDAYGPGMYAYCWAMLADPAEAAGALTDTVLVATAHADALADPADLTAWLYALARAECHRRTPRAYGAVFGRWASGPYAAGPYAAGQTDDVLTMLVARALAGLRPADRELLELSVRHRLSARQLAHVLGIAEHEAAHAAESAVTRFDQTLSTLFMAASGRLAVPREFLTDRPPLRVLLDLLPAAGPPAGLRAGITAAGTDPALSHYRDLVTRRALPLTPTGFPRPPATPFPSPPAPPPASPAGGPPSGAPPSAAARTPHGVPHPRPAPGSDTAFQPREAGAGAAEPGTAGMPLGAPVAPPGERTLSSRPPGGRPTIEPVAADLITPEAITRARTDAPTDAPTEAAPSPGAAPEGRRDEDGGRRDGARPSGRRRLRRGRGEADGGDTSAAAVEDAEGADRGPGDGEGVGREREEGEPGRRRVGRRGSPAGRFWRSVGVVVAVGAVAAGAWAAQRIVASVAAVRPQVVPSATMSAHAGTGAPTPPGMSPSHATKHSARPAETGVPIVTPPHTAEHRHHHAHKRPTRQPSTHPVPVGPFESSPARHPSKTPTHTPGRSHTPTPTETTPTPPEQ